LVELSFIYPLKWEVAKMTFEDVVLLIGAFATIVGFIVLALALWEIKRKRTNP